MTIRFNDNVMRAFSFIDLISVSCNLFFTSLKGVLNTRMMGAFSPLSVAIFSVKKRQYFNEVKKHKNKEIPAFSLENQLLK